MCVDGFVVGCRLRKGRFVFRGFNSVRLLEGLGFFVVVDRFNRAVGFAEFDNVFNGVFLVGERNRDRFKGFLSKAEFNRLEGGRLGLLFCLRNIKYFRSPIVLDDWKGSVNRLSMGDRFKVVSFILGEYVGFYNIGFKEYIRHHPRFDELYYWCMCVGVEDVLFDCIREGVLW